MKIRVFLTFHSRGLNPKLRDARNKAKKLNAISQERKGRHKTRMLIFL